MTNRELVDGAWDEVMQSTISGVEWQNRVKNGYKGKPYNWQNTAFGRAKALLDQVVDVTVVPPGPSDGRTLVFSDEFDGTSLDTTKWDRYYSPGIVGLRRPEAFSLDGQGSLVVTAQMVNGVIVSGGMAANYNRTYGYYEFRVRTEPDPSHTMSGVVLTWPLSGNWPLDGENDMYETGTASRNPFATFIHYGANNLNYGFVHNADATQWHVIGMDWAADHITIYRDGAEVWKLTDPVAIPDVPHHVCVQYDAMVPGVLAQPTRMFVDYVRVWA